SSPTGRSCSGTRTRRARAPRPRATQASRSRMWRQGCAAATCRCRRSTTGSRSTPRPRSSSAPTSDLARRCSRRASPAASTSSATSWATLGAMPANVELLAPVGYLDMAALVSQARVLVTDSGGLQKEAYWYGVPCVTARPSTEWIDTVELGANVLVDDDPEKLAAAVASARMPDERLPLYGDGHAAERVAASLADRG